ncbi:unnamed protein product [Meloidogyne enterolobii]|uniref:Uncharacterized protein n=1 Tax=Meloidogyne enterolobii TaxID=390850 RepID=A0ACB1A3D4_MELEN
MVLTNFMLREWGFWLIFSSNFWFLYPPGRRFFLEFSCEFPSNPLLIKFLSGYNCGGFGHYARDCEGGDGGSGGGGRDRGGRDDRGGGGRGGDMKCYNCNKYGHMSRDCPEGGGGGRRGGGGGGGNRNCYNCGQDG